MKISQEQWMQSGKMMLLISGLACIAFAFYFRDDAISYFLRIWVGLYGIVSILLAINSKRV